MFKRSLVALITPFKDGAIDIPSLEHLIEWHIQEGTHALVVCGSTGEGFFLSSEEHSQVVTCVVRQSKGRIPIIASSGAMTTSASVALSMQSEKGGASALMVVTPPYVKPTQEGMYRHYLAIHEATSLPILIYNNPGRTGGTMQDETLVRLSQLPRIAAVKDSTNCLTRPCSVRALVKDRVAQLTGEDATTLAFLAQGGCGGVSVMGNIAPKLCAQMHAAWEARDLERAFEIRDLLYPLTQALFMESMPASVKYALSIMGLCTGELREPLIQISEQNQREMRDAMNHAGVLSGSFKEYSRA